MAKTQAEPAGTGGSQFFIVTGAGRASCRRDYAIVGKVTDGLDVVTRIGELGDPSTEQPTEVVEIEKATVASRVTVAAVVLAAGAATRYGGPKQREFLPAVLAALAERAVGRGGRRRRRSPTSCGLHTSSRRAVRSLGRWARRLAALRPRRRSASDVEHALVVLADGPELDPRAVERLVERREDGPVVAAALRRRAQPPRGARTRCLARRARRGRPRASSRCSSTAPTWRLQAMSISADREGEGPTRRKEDDPHARARPYA